MNIFYKTIYNLRYYFYIIYYKLLILLTNQRKRLAWAKKHQNWTIVEWKKVLFSDKLTFTVFKTTEKQYV